MFLLLMGMETTWVTRFQFSRDILMLLLSYIRFRPPI